MKNFIASLIVWASFATQAATLATYSFTGAADGTLTGFSDEAAAANVTVSSLVANNMGAVGVVSGWLAPTDASSPAYTFDGKGYRLPASAAANNSTTVPSDYFGFTIQVAPGYMLTLSSVKADFGIDINTATSGSTQAAYDLWASINGGAFSILGSTSVSGSPATTPSHLIRNDVNKNLLSNPASPFTTGIANDPRVFYETDVITFLLAFSDNNSGAATKAVFVDDINVIGVVQVPEPSTFALGAFGLAGWLAFRRRLQLQ